MTTSEDTPFFVGYLPTPPALKLFLVSIAAGAVGMFAALAFALGTTQDDPGTGSFRYDWRAQTVTGTIETRPYPMIHVTTGSKRIAAGSTLTLSGGGKRGVQNRLKSLDGKSATLRGIVLKRGELDALQVGGGAKSIKAVDTPPITVTSEALGRWRLKGEICDGKCLAGAMRPGRGLAHRACANLCLIGGVPPIFVASEPVAGSQFFLLADQDGNALPDAYLNHVAVYISLDGTIERRGKILLFKVDLASLKVLS